MFAKKLAFIMAGICIIFLYACGPKVMAPKAVLDTPEHHVTNGNKFLASGKIDDAMKEFTRAKELDPKFSPAYVGLGLVYGYKKDFKKGFDFMEKAEDYAKGNDQEINVNIGFMRLYIMGGEAVDKDWLEEVEDYQKKALKINPDVAEAYYYMGVAYKMAYEFTMSASQFRKVLSLDKDFVEEANKEYAVIQKIERAMPGTKVGKKIALLEEITRADIAALFIEELEIDKLFASRTPKEFDTSFKSPEKEFKTGEFIKVEEATDIADHVLKADIDVAIKIGIKGLQPFPDHTFQPYKTITRAEFAMMIEDILIKITNNDKLVTKFIGSESPFPDLRSSLPYFNAVMVCTTRNIMEVTDVATGEFDPMNVVSGAEALLSLRTLKIQLNKY